MTQTVLFNVVHAPIGAHAALTLGCPGNRGGFNLENGKSSDENIYVGIERHGECGIFDALPFWDHTRDELADFNVENNCSIRLNPFPEESIARSLGVAVDTLSAGDLTLRIYSRHAAFPDPASAREKELRYACCPALVAELIVDNRQGERPRAAFFGGSFNRLDATYRLPNGFASGQAVAVTTPDPVRVLKGHSPALIYSRPLATAEESTLGDTALLHFEAPPHTRAVFRLVIAFHRSGIVTTGEKMSYFYTRYFPELGDVAGFAQKEFARFQADALADDAAFAAAAARLNAAQRFQLIHAIRSYYASTQLFRDQGGDAVWVVNEGEYRMLNTFDLTVDQLFFELRQNPWTVRNELDRYVMRYSYRDRYGISFTHDMGVRNHFTPPGRSSYECAHLTGCFSYMTREQLVNWALCAALYCHQTGENPWPEIFQAVYESMLNRADPDTALLVRNSDRCGDDGREITTYDSLDQSLGQADGNLYLAVKTLAAYRALADLLPPGNDAVRRAACCAAAIAAAQTADGSLPAILDEPASGRIIPAIEGLIFLYELKIDLAAEFPVLRRVLREHLQAVLRRGACLYEDGGWKLSSTADNSWLSKIYLGQFVARKILDWRTPETGEAADRAHRDWLLLEPNRYWAWSDQMTSGIAKGSKYYPRGVTAILWLEE